MNQDGKSSSTLDYASSGEPSRDFRGFLSILLACGLLSAVVTAWWQVGIRIGQRHERQDVLFEAATGTAFWDRAVIQPPCALLFAGFVGSIVWCVLMMRSRRWGIGAAFGLGLGLLLLLVTMCFNFPLVDEASP